MEFEWDDNKAQINLAKHHIAFEDAAGVFDDPHRLALDVSRPEDGEQRSKIIGKMHNTVLAVVVCTDRDGRIRLISARKAGQNEREHYNQSQSSG